MNKIKKFEVYKKGINLVYKHKYEKYFNEYLKEEWEIDEWNIFRVGIESKLFSKRNYEYDGHTSKGFVLLGISFYVTYTYHARAIENVSK